MRKGFSVGGRFISMAALLRVGSDRAALISDYEFLRERYKRLRERSPAAQAYLDRFYIVEKTASALLDVYGDMPADALVKNAWGGELGLPRIYSLAVELAHRGDGCVDGAQISAALIRYQETAPLTMAEIRAFIDMERLALIKLIRAAADEEAEEARRLSRAAQAADMLLREKTDAGRLALIRRLEPARFPEAAERLVFTLMERDEYKAALIVEEQLCAAGASAQSLAAELEKRRARRASVMANAISSLKSLESANARSFYSAHSKTAAALMEDASYARMDARSREYYDARVEALARKLGAAETMVARTAVRLAKEASERGLANKSCEAGHYLIGDGVCELCYAIRPDRKYRKPSNVRRMLLFILLEIALMAPILAFAATGGTISLLLALFPSWSLARAIAVRLILKLTPVRRIPRIEYSRLSASERAAVVVTPVLIGTEKALCESAENLETHYLANRYADAPFVLLADFPDSERELTKDEEALVKKAAQLIDAMNERYGERFACLWRKRTLSKHDGRYMGRERKRGALEDLVQYMLYGDAEPFLLRCGAFDRNAKYIITLDADTRLPMGALGELVGAAAHPLNAPVYDPSGVVVSGYGVIAPKIKATAESAVASRFSRLFSGDFGLDAYSSQTSEFYQDYFGEGSFCGKGIINVEAYGRTLLYKIRENAVLSHDLLEGCFLRAGFMGDVTLYDGVPSTLGAWWKRQHRWIRGDFQLIPFLLPKLYDAADGARKNPLSFLSKVKIIDNMRRSMIHSSILYTFVIMPYVGAGAYIAISITALAEGLLFEITGTIARLFTSAPRRLNALGTLMEGRDVALRAAYELVTLPYSAVRSGDAMTRAILRMVLTKKKLLEWQTAAQTGNAVRTGSAKRTGVAAYYGKYAMCAVFGLIMAVGAVIGKAPALAAILAACFIAAPVVVRELDEPYGEDALTDAERDTLLYTAKRTWLYFSEFMTEDNNFLPPDNVQTEPVRVTAAGTSPTNIGMGLAAVVAALDIGLIAQAEALSRIAATTSSLERMEKWHGHIYNWYDVKTLAPMRPMYVSSVDSGNLAACLLYAAEAVRAPDKALAARLDALAHGMDFTKLYDAAQALFSIGYDCENGRLSDSRYDMLASEARLTTFVAIAMGQVSAEAWLALSRLLVRAEGERTLVSWSGTMFEYLMPVLFCGAVRDTLMYESVHAAVRAQTRAVAGLPWGISESGYYAFDKNMLYQYKAFGVPKLALSPTRGEETVISPYSTLLALMVDSDAAMANIGALLDFNAMGEYGFFEAIDFTRTRLPGGRDFAVVKSFMAHHQGMSLCALANVLTEKRMIRRFLSVPQVRAASLLLSERRPPLSVTIRRFTSETVFSDDDGRRTPARARCGEARHKTPETQLLSNGRYTVLVSEDGTGFSKRGGVMLTRFSRETEPCGVQLFIKRGDDVTRVGGSGTTYSFEPHCAKFHAQSGELAITAEAYVSPRRNAEVRRVSITNRGAASCETELTALFEASLADAGEDAAHPAFSKLKVDAVQRDGTLFLTRRDVDAKKRVTAYARLVSTSKARYSTDMLALRDKTLFGLMRAPLLPDADVSLPLEPGCIARASVLIRPGETARFAFLLGIEADMENAARACAELSGSLDRVPELAFGYSQGMLRAAGVEPGKAELYERLAARLIYPAGSNPAAARDGAYEPYAPHVPCALYAGLDALWSVGVSGDFPMLVMPVSRQTELRKAKTLIAFAGYIAARGIEADVILIGEYPHEYSNDLRTRLEELIALFGKACPRVRLIHGFELEKRARAALYGNAAVLIDPHVTLDRQVKPEPLALPALRPCDASLRLSSFAREEEKLLLDNGFGGFSQSGGEYVIRVSDERTTPLPWSNILANAGFGTLVTESGGGYAYVKNSRLMKLTAWANDPVRDRLCERVELYDCESGARFMPYRGDVFINGAAEACEYTVRHGFGYTVYSCGGQALDIELTVFADAEAPVKYSLLKIRNPMLKTRRLTLSYASEFLLGQGRRAESVSVSCQDGKVRAISAISGMRTEMAMAESNVSCTLDGGLYARFGGALSELEGSGENAGDFAALLCDITIAGGETRETLMTMGAGLENAAATTHAARERLAAVRRAWSERLNKIRVSTRSSMEGGEAFDIMMNGWLMYQTWSSRILARMGYYQCGGAYGFRDQIQDMLAVLRTPTDEAKRTVRAHIIKCASMQFRKGDVLHWWHETGAGRPRGVRTDIRDDRLFLPLAALDYVRVTGDASLFDDVAPYLADRPIPLDKTDLYAEFFEEPDSAETVYSHCVRAIDSAMLCGTHGLALMGGGDWNDGMDAVGKNGGESVWLSMLLIYVMEGMTPVARARGDETHACKYEADAAALRSAIEAHAWDGHWYLRAYYGDGTKLGSHENELCAIDCITQAWAALIRLDHAEEAVSSAKDMLFSKQDGIIKLLMPAFAEPDAKTGYITSYIQGVRENGAQYTHGAAWLALAACALHRAEDATELYSALLPINHARSQGDALHYKAEPYAVAGDVYSSQKHAGRAGWTWYTGAAAWLYITGLEGVLGVKRRGDKLYIEPCFKGDAFSLEYEYYGTTYEITAKRGEKNSPPIELSAGMGRRAVEIMWKG